MTANVPPIPPAPKESEPQQLHQPQRSEVQGQPTFQPSESAPRQPSQHQTSEGYGQPTFQPEPAAQYPSHPHLLSPGYGQPPFLTAAQAAPPQYAPPGGYAGQPQAYGQPQRGYPAQQTHYPQSAAHYAMPSWVYGPQRTKSGVRTAGGVLTIVMSAWLIVCSISGFGSAKTPMAVLLLLLAFASIAAGIFVLAMRWNKNVQVFALVCAGVAALLGAIAPLFGYYGPVLPSTLMPLAVAAIILLSISVSREKFAVRAGGPAQ
ncbi:hypothetical protein [Arthrobacter bambusae]|uniref:hypothetical protein n=1 Tax=Arthrobacter bambusae TaxID=1338426 RepID=UPI00277F7818|nr:hypothetical protein [Arthrobacter bambusae]MDQ0239525.1 hypothetical protein [Arthrobacter bambusae]